MSEITRFTSDRSGYMLGQKDGGWVRYQDHLAEVERLNVEVERLKAMLPPTAHTGVRNGPGAGSWSVFAGKVMEERDEAQAEVERLRAELTEAKTRIQTLTDDVAIAEMDTAGADAWAAAEEAETARVTAQRDAAQAEVKQLKAEMTDAIVRIRAMTLAVEQADEAKADAEAAAAAEEAETDRVTAERDAAQAEVERLRSERDMARTEVQRLIAERDQTANRPKGREVGRFGLDGHYLDAMEPTRPTDEDIWLKLWLHSMPDFGERDAAEMADGALAEYRKRWPR